MRSAIFAQCFGMLPQQMLTGGILLLYLNAMGVKPALILLVLNLTPFLSSFLSVPLAWGADCVGIKRFGSWGNFLMIVGVSFYCRRCVSAWCGTQALLLPAILIGLVIHTVGAAFFNTGWFSLLSHIVPTEVTGRFFGVLRFSWQLISLVVFCPLRLPVFNQDTAMDLSIGVVSRWHFDSLPLPLL